MRNWKTQEANTGLMFFSFGAFFGIKTLLDHELGSLEEMGPGFFPLTLCVILVALGICMFVRAQPQVTRQKPINWRAVALIGTAPVAFALTVRSLGLLPALLVSVALAVLASSNGGLLRGAILVVGVTLFCIVVFKFGVRIPYELINPNLLQ